MTEREEQFENMLAEILKGYQSNIARMETLKKDGKTRSITYRELMCQTQEYRRLLRLYQQYGLITNF